MNTDVAGRVRNVQLPTSKPLLPIFEAIMNSIHAIEDAAEKHGRIEIEVLRTRGLFGPTDKFQTDVCGFIVRDNGIGFNDQNFQAFATSDTTYKASRGGKGIGRFMWLAGFDRVEVESIFRTDGKTMRRRFEFRARGTGIENDSCTEVNNGEPGTTVKLIDYKEKFQKQCPKRIETIAAFIVEEFLEYFIGPSNPIMIVRDSQTGETLSLDNVFEEEMASKISKQDLTLKGTKFELLHVRLHSPHITDHRLYLCAHGRAVTSEKLVGKLPNLSRHLLDESGNAFVYAVYVNSQLLNDTVNPDRTAFNLSEEPDSFGLFSITMAEIKSDLVEACRSFLAPYTAPIVEQKRARIEEFVQKDGAMYRPILKRLESSIEVIDLDATDDEIDRKLYEGYHALQVRLREEGQQLMRSPTASDSDLQEFEQRFQKYFEEISEVNKADLARYVCHRKAIIEFLQRQLSLNDEGKYRREERVHSIIFPRGTTSDEILFEDHNLWLVDERLAFHAFLSSDKPIKQLAPLENTSKKEPDIVVFDKAVAFSEARDVPFSSITILEFKKPQRDDYSERENPFTQVAKYIKEIKEGKAVTAAGRPMPIPPNLPFYCYIVCDITPSLKDWALFFELQETPDGLGYFGYKKAFNAYFEVISYSKLVADAEKRNKVFFQKLGLPGAI